MLFDLCTLKKEHFLISSSIPNPTYAAGPSYHPGTIKVQTPSLTSSRVIYFGFAKNINGGPNYWFKQDIGGVMQTNANRDNPNEGDIKITGTQGCSPNGLNIYKCATNDGEYFFDIGGQYDQQSWYAAWKIEVNTATDCNAGSQRFFKVEAKIYNAKEDSAGSYMVDINSVAQYDGKPVVKSNSNVKGNCELATTSDTSMPACPDPMYDSWMSYGQITGFNKCNCAGNTCIPGQYCVDGVCKIEPAKIPDCYGAMISWESSQFIRKPNDYSQHTGPNAQCQCSPTEVCRKDAGTYCVTNFEGGKSCKNAPVCTGAVNTALTRDCYCRTDPNNMALDNTYNTMCSASTSVCTNTGCGPKS